MHESTDTVTDCEPQPSDTCPSCSAIAPGLADSPEARPEGGPLGPESGAPPCNTAPDTCIGGHPFRVLRTGVDSLYLSYPGQLSKTWEARLRDLKLTAQSSEPSEAATAQVQIGEHLFEVLDRGSQRYAYTLADNCFRFQIASSEAHSLPLAHVHIASELLTLQGPAHAEIAARFVANTLGLVNGDPKVSRLDLCVDVATDFPMDSWNADAWVTRAHRIDPHYVQGHFTGWSVGSGGDMVCRLYDKTRELERNPREYLTVHWRDAGWTGDLPVWRLEFQFRRAVLKEMGISSPDELPRLFGGLWAYGLTEWLRLTVPVPLDQTRSRWPTHPLWSAFAAVDWNSPSVPLVRVRTERLPRDDYLFRNGLAGLTSFMAARRIVDPDEGMRRYLAEARQYHDASRHGKPYTRYMLEKLYTKARRYNTLNNTPDDPEQRAADATAYRRGKDGE